MIIFNRESYNRYIFWVTACVLVLLIQVIIFNGNLFFKRNILSTVYSILFFIPVVYFYKKSKDIFSPQIIVPFIYFILYFVGSMPIVYGNTKLGEIPQSQYFYYFIGGASFYIGTFLVGRSELNPFFQVKNRAWNNKFFLVILLFVWSIGFLGFSLIVIQAGIPILNREAGIYRITMQSQIRNFGVVNLLFQHNAIFLILSTHFLFTSKASRFVKSCIFFALLTSIFELMAFGNRGMVIFPLFTVLILYNYTKKRLGLLGGCLLTFVFLLTIGFLGYLRSSYGYNVNLVNTISKSIHEIVITPSNFSKIVSFFPQYHQFFWGKGLLASLLTILPGKQYLLDIELKNLLNLSYSGGGFPPTILGSFYVDFGIPGIILGMLTLGAVLMYTYKKAIVKREPLNMLVYIYLVQYVVSGIRNLVTIEFILIYTLLLLTFIDRFMAGRIIRNR